MEAYTPIRGMIICSGESGDYIKKSDYLKLKSAVSAHIKACRGWFGDDHVWEQIIAHNEWEGK